MRLTTFLQDGEARVGALVAQAGDPGATGPGVPYGETGTLFDLSAAARRTGRPLTDLATALGEGPAGLERLQALLAEARRENLVAGAGARTVAPILRPGKLVCAAGNYQAHIKEGGGSGIDKAKSTPRLFLKPPTSIVGPDEALEVPLWSEQVDWELELGVVVGRPGRCIPAERAMEHVGGYVIFNDISARTLTVAAERTYRPWDEFFDWLNGKWFDTFSAMGPVLVTPDEIADPHALRMQLSVNGRVFQDASTDQMIFRIEELLSFASYIMKLEPGDIIATGTPSGVGAASGTFLRPGDIVEGTVDGLGTLRNPVVAAPPAAVAWRVRS